MKHINSISKAAPAPASLLVTQQKVAIFAAFAAALGVFGNALGVLRDLVSPD